MMCLCLGVRMCVCVKNVIIFTFYLLFVYFISFFLPFYFEQVAWVRVDTQTILSIHHNVITQNHRITLTHNDHRSWYLHIKNVDENDRGWYMCQINTGK